MPIKILDKKKCTGCEACESICPKNCIMMQRDDSGFLYPVVDKSNCIDCDLCIKTCPVVTEKPFYQKDEKKVYCGWSRDEKVRFASTSGGMFSELALEILRKNGYIAAAAYNDKCDVEHIIVNDKAGVERIRQSKYTQSNINGIYVDVRNLLKEGNLVLFSGTPCQVAGLKRFLRKEYLNLITVDFICRGVNSPKAYRSWLSELEKRYNSKVIKVWFKYKEYGWKNSPLCTRVDFEDGKNCILYRDNNTYMKGYLGPNLYIRPCCGDCKFKGNRNYSDLTLADYWGASKEVDDDKGTSLVLVNSKAGNDLLQEIKENIVLFPCQEEYTRQNLCYTDSVKINPKSEEFLTGLDEELFSQRLERYTRVLLGKRIIQTIKRICSRMLRFIT